MNSKQRCGIRRSMRHQGFNEEEIALKLNHIEQQLLTASDTIGKTLRVRGKYDRNKLQERLQAKS